MLKAVDMRKGRTIIYEGTLYTIHEVSHVAKGNKRSYMQAKLKDFKSGNMTDVRFNVDDRVEVPFVETKEYEYLYQDGKDYILMDQATFDQIHVAGELFGDGINYLIPNTPVTCEIYEGKIVKIMDFGAFVNFFGPRDGLVHISELAPKRVAKVSDVVKEGDLVKVKLIGIDDRGKVRLSMKVVDQATGKEIVSDKKDEGAAKEHQPAQ